MVNPTEKKSFKSNLLNLSINNGNSIKINLNKCLKIWYKKVLRDK